LPLGHLMASRISSETGLEFAYSCMTSILANPPFLYPGLFTYFGPGHAEQTDGQHSVVSFAFHGGSVGCVQECLPLRECQPIAEPNSKAIGTLDPPDAGR